MGQEKIFFFCAGDPEAFPAPYDGRFVPPQSRPKYQSQPAIRELPSRQMSSEATQILCALSDGDRSQIDRLFEITYDDLRSLAQTYLDGDTPGNTLQPTAVVHEVFLKIVNHDEVGWRGRSHFFAIGATAMRQVLVDHARRKGAAKRGGGRTRVLLDDRLTVSVEREEDVLELHEALERLEQIDESRARIVEMRFFAGMTLEEIAAVRGVSHSTIKRQWAATSSWLRAELREKSQQ